MATTWNYDGSGTLVITLDDAIPTYHYFATCFDSDSTNENAVASSSTLAITITGIGGDAAGYQFGALVQQGNASGVDSPDPFDCVAANIFNEGTAATTGTIGEATWAYDGSTGLSVTFTAIGGVTYLLQCNPDRSFFDGTVTGGPYTDGSTQTLSLTLRTPIRTSFEAVLFNNDTFDAYSDRIFTAGSADAGAPGNPTSAPPPPVEGRVLIAFDDGPLVASPTWTRIDGADAPFPDQFVSGYDVTTGRQTLLSQTDTGTATVYINDHETGLFDPRDVTSPYFGKLNGRQIKLMLYDPVAAAWEDQFRGWIDDITWNMDPSGLNAGIQIACVDMFAYLGEFGLTPGLAGVLPTPAGGEDGVWYAEGHADDRMIEILTDATIDPAMYGSPSLASMNVRTQPVKYDPDESALQALRDAADAEFPFICNMYCDRHGKFQARGRYGRFDPDDVAAEPGSDWDFTRWAAGDGAAIIADADRAQLRTFSFGRNRSDIINVAIGYPQGMSAVHMPNQVYADTTSITDYGKHDAPPMSDLLTADTGMTSGSANGREECFKYAKLLVLNQKDPRETITTLGFKAMRPDGSTRAQQTWALITKADISHIVNVAVGYPSGTGLFGSTPEDDYYIEGRQLRVRPLNPDHDYVELDLDVSPAVWSMDINAVFPDFASVASSQTPTLTAGFAYSA